MSYISKGVEKFVETAISIIESVSIEEALHVASFLGEVLWKNSVGIYQLAKIELALVERFESLIPSVSDKRICRFAHVLTKAYDTGGHTRLVERLVATKSLEDSRVLVTHATAPVAYERLSRAFHGCTVLLRAPKPETRLASLVAAFSQCEVLILYVHPYDIESVVAAGIAKRRSGVRVLFFNHADHVFSWGYGVADRILEISHYGWALRQKRRCENRSVFVGIPLELPNVLVAKPALMPLPHGVVMAAGTAYKFRPTQSWSFPKFIQSLCQSAECDVAVVGPNVWCDWWWWPALLILKKRLNIRSRLEYDDYLVLMSKAVAFVDSFPLAGGTAFAEIISRGVPGFGVLTGSHGYSPADLVKSASLTTLLDDLVNFIATGKRAGVDDSDLYARIHEVHDKEAVASRILGAVSGSGIDEPPPWPCTVNVDIAYFERIWVARRFPIMPVHMVPPLSLLLPFLRLKE